MQVPIGCVDTWSVRGARSLPLQLACRARDIFWRALRVCFRGIRCSGWVGRTLNPHRLAELRSQSSTSDASWSFSPIRALVLVLFLVVHQGCSLRCTSPRHVESLALSLRAAPVNSLHRLTSSPSLTPYPPAYLLPNRIRSPMRLTTLALTLATLALVGTSVCGATTMDIDMGRRMPFPMRVAAASPAARPPHAGAHPFALPWNR